MRVLVLSIGVLVVGLLETADARLDPVVVITPADFEEGDTVLFSGAGISIRTFNLKAGEFVLADQFRPDAEGRFTVTAVLPEGMNPNLLSGLTLGDPTPNERPDVSVNVIRSDDPETTIAELEAIDASLNPTASTTSVRTVTETVLKTNPLWPALAIAQIPLSLVLLAHEVARRGRSKSRRSSSSSRSSEATEVFAPEFEEFGNEMAESEEPPGPQDATIRRKNAARVRNRRNRATNVTAFGEGAPNRDAPLDEEFDDAEPETAGRDSTDRPSADRDSADRDHQTGTARSEPAEKSTAFGGPAPRSDDDRDHDGDSNATFGDAENDDATASTTGSERTASAFSGEIESDDANQVRRRPSRKR